MKINKFLNKALYQKRLDKGLTTKEASKFLHITRLHLRLIERGYWGVNKKLQPKFIKLYGLEKDFFTNVSNFPVVIDKDDSHIKVKKMNSLILKKWVGWTSVGIAAVSMGVIGYGIYALNKKELKPKDKWTKDFSDFHQRMSEAGEEQISVLYPGDLKYVVYDKNYSEYEDGLCTCSIQTYSNPSHASDTSIDSSYYFKKDVTEFKHIKKDAYIEFDTFAYNKKKIVYSSFTSPNENGLFIGYATGILNNDGSIDLKPFTYVENKVDKKATEGTEVYKEFKEVFNKYVKRSFTRVNNVLQENFLVYKDVNDLVKDIQIICRDNILHFRLGIWLTIVFSALGVFFLFILSLHFYLYYKHRKRIRTIYKKTTIEQIALSPICPKRDIKFRLFIPEFVMRVFSYIMLTIAAIWIIMIVYTFFESSASTFIETLRGKSLTSNLLTAGIVLLFFLSLDNYAYSSERKLLKSIITFLLIGIVFYIAELTIFYSFSTRGNIYSLIFSNMSSLLPGNIFWPLGLYALLFFLLFITPARMKKNKKKLNSFRLLAIIPTFLLVFNLIWQFAIKKNVDGIPFWINFWFYSKNPFLIIFLLLYIYSLFIYRHFKVKQYGVEYAEQVYFHSNKYSLVKNSIASSMLTIIFVADLIIKFKQGNTEYFGDNWVVGLIIPFILFYRPHIGDRNKKWDLACKVLGPLTSSIGYIGAFIEIFAFLEMGQIFYLMF